MTVRDYWPNTVLRYHWFGLSDLFLSDLLTALNNDVGHMRSVWCLLIVFPKTDMPYDVSPSMTALFFFFFVVNFGIHWNEKNLGSHVFPIPIPPPTSLPTRSLQVLPEHQVRVLVSSADEWTRKLWYIYTMEYYSAIKKNSFESVLMR